MQVPGCYLKGGRGYQPDAAQVGSPGQSPLSFSNPRRPPSAPFRRSPLQPSETPPKPSAERSAAAEEGDCAVRQLSGEAEDSSALAEDKIGATADNSADEAKHASLNGQHPADDAGLASLSLEDTGIIDTELQKDLQNCEPGRRGLSSNGLDQSLQHASSQNNHTASEHSKEGSASAADASLEADEGADSAQAEPELVAVAERAEHAAAAVAAEGLELDRSSEPAALAAVRSGSLAPGD